jgi:hypothetical protein
MIDVSGVALDYQSILPVHHRICSHLQAASKQAADAGCDGGMMSASTEINGSALSTAAQQRAHKGQPHLRSIHAGSPLDAISRHSINPPMPSDGVVTETMYNGHAANTRSNAGSAVWCVSLQDLSLPHRVASIAIELQIVSLHLPVPQGSTITTPTAGYSILMLVAGKSRRKRRAESQAMTIRWCVRHAHQQPSSQAEGFQCVVRQAVRDAGKGRVMVQVG